LHNNKSVYIQERAGVVIIGDDVTIDPVAISHGNLTISSRSSTSSGGSFVELAPKDNPAQPRLKNLVDALNVLNVPTADVIAIIKGLKKQGNLYGELRIE
jgi:flagellar P-ring protein FlgI